MDKSRECLIQPVSQRVYGEVVYWLSIVASMICAVAPVIAVASPGRNIANPHFLYRAIWEGMEPLAVWETAGSGFPGGNFWLGSMTYGDGLAAFGLALGCYSAGVALLATAGTFLIKKPRAVGWGIASIAIAALITLAAAGVYQQV